MNKNPSSSFDISAQEWKLLFERMIEGCIKKNITQPYITFVTTHI
jgi:hypothetical protein